MLRHLIRALPLLAALLFAGIGIARPGVATDGTWCVIVLIAMLGIVFDQIWRKVDAYGKRISELEQQLNRYLSRQDTLPLPDNLTTDESVHRLR